MKKEDRAKKVMEKMQMRKYAFGTGLAMNILPSLISADLTSGISGFNSLSSAHNQANPIWNMPEGGQQFAFGGDVGEDSGPGDPDPNTPKSRTIYSPKDYAINYSNSSIYKQRLALTGGGTKPQNAEDLYNTQITYSPNEDTHADTKYPGNWSNNIININKNQLNKIGANLDEAKAHEFSHVTRKLSNQEQFNIYNLSKDPFLTDFKKNNIYNKSNIDLLTKNISKTGDDFHDSRPDENKADLDALRYQMYKRGIYDTSKGDLDQVTFDKALADPEIKNSFTTKRLLKSFKPDDIIKMNNTIAQVPQNDNNMENSIGKFAFGGTTGSQVEVEGNEVAETPNGQMMQFQGPSHEQGGIQTNLPQGTKIFSDRLSVDGKTMQQRKIGRERQMKKLDTMLDGNQTDAINRNTYNRQKAALDAEEQSDLMMQQIANSAYSSGIMPPTGKAIQQYQQRMTGQPQSQPDEADDEMQHFAFGTDDDGIIPYNKYANLLGIPNTITNNSKGSSLLSSPTDNSNAVVPYQIPQSPATPDPNAGLTKSRGFTMGDNLGFLGNGLGTALPLVTTVANRMGDQPNISPYRNFGFNALNSNDKAMNFVSTMRDKNLKDLSTQIASQRVRNRNSATSVGTSRALDQVTSAQQEGAEDNIYGQFAQQMGGQYNERSKLNNQQDLYQGMGLNLQDTHNRMDRDSFYSNMGKNFANIATNFQTTGKELNQHQNNEDILSILPYLSKYGLGFMYDENGTPVMTKAQ